MLNKSEAAEMRQINKRIAQLPAAAAFNLPDAMFLVWYEGQPKKKQQEYNDLYIRAINR